MSTPARQPSREEEDDLPECGTTCWAITIGVIAILFGALVYVASGPVDPLDSSVVEFSNDGVLRTVVWAGRVGGSQARGPNGPDTDWAVFFYKPYCGACKRVWPAFRAVAATTNSSGRLRFGEVNCVKDQHVCSMLKADKHPLIRLYKATEPAAAAPSTASGGGKGKKASAGGFKREVAAEWQGMLISYEVVNWFLSLQQGDPPLVHKSIAWPAEEALADAMRRFRARGTTQVETSMTKRPDDPAGYLTDVQLALQWGLADHVFPTDVPLAHDRLAALLRWLDLQTEVFPQAAVRGQLKSLVSRLGQRTSWERGAFEKTVRSVGFSTTPPEDDAWRWCAPSTGRGGYTCGLWLLFHTTLANAPRHVAPGAVEDIGEWVARFFGCTECARHFGDYYRAHDGAHVQGGQIGAVVWLWKAHNAVSMRLREEELASDGRSIKAMWPPAVDCDTCFNATDTDGTATAGSGGAWGASDMERRGKGEWQPHNVFEYHQELYCFESDTYVCSGFDDTSKEKGSRTKRAQAA